MSGQDECERTIRVLIADDHPVVREGLRRVIGAEPGMEIVGEAHDGVEAAALCGALRPSVVLLDLVMPEKTGLEAIGDIRRSSPDTRIIILTSFAEDDKILTAIRAGAVGFLLKDSPVRDLLQAIRSVERGHSFLHPEVAARIVRELGQPAETHPAQDTLTPREIDVLRLVGQGLSNQEIADRLSIGERTVRNHVSNILDKLYLPSRRQAMLYALREGLASVDGN